MTTSRRLQICISRLQFIKELIELEETQDYQEKFSIDLRSVQKLADAFVEIVASREGANHGSHRNERMEALISDLLREIELHERADVAVPVARKSCRRSGVRSRRRAGTASRSHSPELCLPTALDPSPMGLRILPLAPQT